MNEKSDEGLSTSQAWVLGFVMGALVLVLLAVAYSIGFNRGESEGEGRIATEAPAETTATEEEVAAGPGLDLFAETCGGCHVLEAAGTTGTVGPDLDGLSPDSAQVLAAIENGGTGSGAMPAGLLQGEEAQEVADFVGGSAGK